MKHAENNEMDLLLRSLARREGIKPFRRERLTDPSGESAHLDADELSAYAEQTLPATTRARYTIHLADCSRCRKIVAELAPVVTMSVRDRPEEQSETTFWQSIRHVFSVPVLKYAVPALGLFVIVVVGLVVFRQQPRSDMVAQNEPAAERVVTQNQLTEVPQEKAAGTEETKSFNYSTPNVNAEQKAKSDEQGKATGASPGVSAPAVVAKDVPAEKAAEATAQPTFAPEPAAPPPPKPQDQVAGVRKETVTRTEAASRPQSAPAKVPDTDRDNYVRSGERMAEEERSRGKAEKREAQGAGAPASNAARNRSGLAKLDTVQSLRTDSADKKADDETVETRAVAGRRFRRQGNLWVDTAYHSGLALTVVTRGSEQYRALVADEPSIRTIAEQLQGEVILIWKGRGYRIR